MSMAERGATLAALPDAPTGWRRVLPLLRRHPAVATPRVMGTATGGMFAAGGIFALLGTLTDGSMLEHPDGVRALAAAAAVVGVAVLLGRDRTPRAAYHLIVLLGTAIITAGVWLSGSPSSPAFAALYVFVAIGCFFFAPLAATGHILVMLAGAELAFADTSAPVSWQLLSLGSTVCVAVVVGWLVRRADAAELDPLTGLLNRRCLDEVMTDALDRAEASGPVAVLTLDLDRFKEVNDTLGHAAGDALLVAVAGRLRSHVREGDVVARLGGDEFLVMLADDAAAQRAPVLAHRLLEAISAPFDVAGHVVRVGVSVGVALAGRGQSADAVMRASDRAMYRAKEDGRGRVVSADDAWPGPRDAAGRAGDREAGAAAGGRS